MLLLYRCTKTHLTDYKLLTGKIILFRVVIISDHPAVEYFQIPASPVFYSSQNKWYILHQVVTPVSERHQDGHKSANRTSNRTKHEETSDLCTSAKDARK